MRIVWILVALMATADFSRAQTRSSCLASPALVAAYQDDVMDMAIERMYAIRTPDTAFIIVPRRYQDSIMASLAAVCNLGPQLSADSLFNIYCVHRMPYYPALSTRLEVVVDTNYAWVKPWIHGSSMTGNAIVDGLLSLHGVVLRGVSGSGIAVLEARQHINLRAFGDSLEHVPGVLNTETSSVGGDGNHILFTKDSDSHFQFIVGRGDCLAGCICRKIWNYTVSATNCIVTLDSVTLTNGCSNPRVPDTFCNIYAATAVAVTKGMMGLSLYPNPVADVFEIKGAEDGAKYKAFDQTGRLVFTGQIDGLSKVDARFLPSGVYVLLLCYPSGAAVIKPFVKD